MGRRSEITPWQLEVLARAAELAEGGIPGQKPPSFTDVGTSLGVGRHQVVSALERLESRFKVTLVEERPEGLVITRPEAVARVVTILEELEQFERAVSSAEPEWWLRLDGYWAHVTCFLADAIHQLEHRVNEDRHRTGTVHIRFGPRFGEARSHGGAGLLAAVVAGEMDLVVAPTDGTPNASVAAVPCHRTVMVAAIGPDHPAQRLVDKRRRTIEVTELFESGLPLLVSPKGHFGRDILGLYQGVGMRPHIELSGSDPAALVALGRTGERVPIIASDSVVPGLGAAAGDWELPPDWVALRTADGLLGRSYSIYHRVHIERARTTAGQKPVPPPVATLLGTLAHDASKLARARLEARVARWDTKKHPLRLV